MHRHRCWSKSVGHPICICWIKPKMSRFHPEAHDSALIGTSMWPTSVSYNVASRLPQCLSKLKRRGFQTSGALGWPAAYRDPTFPGDKRLHLCSVVHASSINTKFTNNEFAARPTQCGWSLNYLSRTSFARNGHPKASCSHD